MRRSMNEESTVCDYRTIDEGIMIKLVLVGAPVQQKQGQTALPTVTIRKTSSGESHECNKR
jgi:hypothetical protein